MSKNNDELNKLNHNLEKLSARLKRIHSTKYVFFRGIIMGTGTVVGATVVVALVLTLILQFSELLGLRSFFERVLPEEAVSKEL